MKTQLGMASAIVLFLALAITLPVTSSSLALTSPHGMDDIEIDQGVSYSLEVGIHNEGENQVHIMMSADGSISQYLSFSLSEFDLAGKESKRVTVNISPPPLGTFEGLITATQTVTVEGAGMHTGVSLSAPIKVNVVEPASPPDDNDDLPPAENDNIPPDENDDIPPADDNDLPPPEDDDLPPDEPPADGDLPPVDENQEQGEPTDNATVDNTQTDNASADEETPSDENIPIENIPTETYHPLQPVLPTVTDNDTDENRDPPLVKTDSGESNLPWVATLIAVVAALAILTVLWVRKKKKAPPTVVTKGDTDEAEERADRAEPRWGPLAVIISLMLLSFCSVSATLAAEEGMEGTATVLNVPPTTTNLKTEGMEDPIKIVTLTPTFSWTYADANGDNQSHWQVWVGTSQGTNDMWNSDEMSGTDTSDIYAGSTLSRGATYYVQVATKDNIEWSEWATGTFRINQLPTQVYSEQTFYEDYTPTLVWDFSDPDEDTQLGVKIQVDNDPGFDSLLWDYSDTTTTVHYKVYAGEALEKEVTYYARVQVRDSSTEWSGTWSDNTFTILPIATLVVTGVAVDNTLIDRIVYWAGDGVARIYATAKDNEGRDAIENAYFWIRDANDTVVVDNVIHTGYENGDDENTKKFWYDYDPANILSDSTLGEFDVKVQAVSANFENTKDYTELGFKLFTVDDHSITFTPVREIYAEGEIITFEPVVKSVASGLAVDNAYLKLELISELGEVLRTVAGNTNVSGKLSTHTTLLETDVGFYDVKISTSKGQIDGQKVYEDAFSVVAELPVSVESITPADDYVSGLLRSRSIVSEDVKVKIFVYDTTGTELLNLTSSTIRVENIAPQLQDWEVPYGLTLAEGTYSYRVEVWASDLGTMYHVAFAEVKLTVAPSQQSVGEWSCVGTVETKDGTFDVELYRESLVTNPTTVDKTNFYFREVVDAPQGSSVLVTVEGLPPTTLTVDKFGTIEKYFDIPASITIKVKMEVLIISAVKVEFLSEEEVVATASVPGTLREFQYLVTNLTSTVLRELKLTFPVNEVVLAVDEEGRSLDFWESESTVVEIPELGSYGEVTLTLSAKAPPTLDKMIERLITWVPFFGIPIVVLTFGAGVFLCLLARRWAGILAKFILLLLPTLLLMLAMYMGWI